jgi:hypothetical protein
MPLGASVPLDLVIVLIPWIALALLSLFRE